MTGLRAVPAPGGYTGSWADWLSTPAPDLPPVYDEPKREGPVVADFLVNPVTVKLRVRGRRWFRRIQRRDLEVVAFVATMAGAAGGQWLIPAMVDHFSHTPPAAVCSTVHPSGVR